MKIIVLVIALFFVGFMVYSDIGSVVEHQNAVERVD